MDSKPISAIIGNMPFLTREHLARTHPELREINRSLPHQLDSLQIDVRRRENTAKVIIDESCFWYFEKNPDLESSARQTRITQCVMTDFKMCSRAEASFVDLPVMAAFEKFIHDHFNRKGTNIRSVTNFGDAPPGFTNMHPIGFTDFVSFTSCGDSYSSLIIRKKQQ